MERSGSYRSGWQSHPDASMRCPSASMSEPSYSRTTRFSHADVLFVSLPLADRTGGRPYPAAVVAWKRFVSQRLARLLLAILTLAICANLGALAC